MPKPTPTLASDFHSPTLPSPERYELYSRGQQRDAGSIVNVPHSRAAQPDTNGLALSAWTNTLPCAAAMLLRKEVIQPHLPVRLPCYDLVLIASPTLDGSLPQGVGPPASGVTDFHDLTGGVYKARERIHRSVADLRLLATPTSWGRVADPNPN